MHKLLPDIPMHFDKKNAQCILTNRGLGKKGESLALVSSIGVGVALAIRSVSSSLAATSGLAATHTKTAMARKSIFLVLKIIILRSYDNKRRQRHNYILEAITACLYLMQSIGAS